MTKEELINDLEQAISNQNENTLQELARKALSDFPEETFGYEYTLRILMNRTPRDTNSIEACYIKLIQLNASDNHYTEAYAAFLQEEGDFEKAASVYRSMYQGNPNDVIALLGLGNFFLHIKEDIDAAIPYLENAAAHEEAGSEAFKSLAIAYHQMGQKEDALKLLDISLFEEFTQEAAVLKIEILSELGRNEETLELYNTLIGSHPNLLAYRYNFAKVLDALEQFGTAVYQYEAAIKIAEKEDMATAAIYLEYGTALLRIGSYEKSIEAIKNSLIISENPIAQVQLLMALRGAKQYEEAKSLGASLLANPNLGDIFKKNARHEMGMLHIALEDWKAARKIFEELSKSAGAKALGSFGLGVLADKEEGDVSKAMGLLKSALSMGHKEAAYYIEDELYEKLAIIKSSLLAENKEASDLTKLSSLADQLLVFKGVLKEGKLDVDSNLQRIFEHTVFYINPTGGFILYNDGFQNHFVHQAVEKENRLELNLIYLDGQTPKKMQLSENNGDLIYQDRADRQLVFTPLKDMTAEVRTMFFKYINFQELEFLGAASLNNIKAEIL